MKKLLITLSFLVCLSNIKAQQSLTLYNMQAIPQAMYVNPGAMPLTNVNIGLPGISSNYVNYGNNGFTMHDLIKKDVNGGLLIDANNFMGKLKPNNYLNINLHTDILSVGFKVKKVNYFSFNITERVDIRLGYTKDFFSLLVNGNGAAANLNRDMNIKLALDASHFREWGFNYTREVNKKLTIGGRFKILSGMENANTEKTNLTINTNSQYYAITANANLQANTSGVDSASQSQLSKNSNSMLGFNPSRKNHGYGIDLGATYRLNDKFSFSASIIDLGFITWAANTTNYTTLHQKVQYNGVSINKADSNFGQSVQNFGDSLGKSFGYQQNHASYRTMLTTQFYLGGNYWLNDKNNVGLVLHGAYANKQLNPAMCLSFNNKVGRWLSASVSYSILNRSYDNVGLGLAFTGGVQFYVVSDNILSFLVYDRYQTEKSQNNSNNTTTTTTTSFLVPAYSRNINLRFGINIAVGKIPNDKDHDGIPDKDDACPDVAGHANLHGCPDRDGDGVPDIRDRCPDEPGLPDLMGCPDKDMDGIADVEDKCPNDKGPAEFDGCPDRDGDKIIDKEDECPDEAGLVEFMGCPDKDADGTPDKFDLCPSDTGPKENKGCPDKDGDKVLDKDDACPDVAGPVENKGCPQTKLYLLDKDGKTVAISIKSANGWFTFENIPADESSLFKLDPADGALTSVIVDYKGVQKEARKREDGLYHFTVEIKAAEKKILEQAFSHLLFASGTDIIKPESFPSLIQLATLLKEHSGDWTLKLAGHTDNQGKAEDNLLLSEKRVKAVKKYLVSKGVKEDKIVTEFFGHSQPVESNEKEAGRAKNRCVEMKILYK